MRKGTTTNTEILFTSGADKGYRENQAGEGNDRAEAQDGGPRTLIDGY